MAIYAVRFVGKSFLRLMNVILITFFLSQKVVNPQRIIVKSFALIVILKNQIRK